MASIKDNQKMNYHKKPPLPVDRGWAWFIMIGAYIIMLVAYSLGRCLSLFLPDILERYNKPATVTTLAFGVGDLSFTITNIAIPSLLLPRFNVRTLALWGAFLHCFGVISLAYSPNIIIFNCLFAVFGVSGGLMIVTSLIHLGHYFKKRLSFASAVTQIGASTAMVLVPRLAQFLKDTYGYQGALLIIGGISFHCVAAAMLLWPVSMFDDPNHAKEDSDNSSKNPLQKLGNTIPMQMSFIIEAGEEGQEEEINEESKFLRAIDLSAKRKNELNSTSDLKSTAYILKEQLLADSKDVQNSELNPQSETSTAIFPSQINQDELHTKSSRISDLSLDVQVSNKSDTYTQSKQSISSPNDNGVLDFNAADKETQNQNAIGDPKDKYARRSSEESISNQTALIQNGSNDNQDGTISVTSEGCCSIHKMKASLSSSILLNPVALMLILAGGMSTLGGNMYLPVLGLENGLTPDEVPWMLTIIGIADILGKLGIGYFADLGYVRPIRIACLTQFTVGMVCQFTTFYKGFGPMAGMAIIFGMMNGVVQSLLPAMIIEMLGLPYLAQVISVFYLSTGVFTFVLNVIVGAVKDTTGSFFGGFNFLGGMMLTSCAILMLEPAFVRCRNKLGRHRRTLVKPM